MAFSKAWLFEPIPFQQSIWSKALSHPARINILTYLLEHGITPFYELRKLIPLASTTVSQHLSKLRSLGLIEAEEKCPHTFYKLNKSICKSLANKISNLHSEFSLQDDTDINE